MRKYSSLLALTASIYCCMVMSCGGTDNKPETKTAVSDRPAGCGPVEVSDKAWFTSGKKALLFDGFDVMPYPITTKSDEARQYFNQGLLLSFAFNHAEAARSFFQVTRLDPACAMGWWGLAYVLGPNYNAGMEKDNFERAYEAASKARKMAPQASVKEQDLIRALSARYSADTSITRAVLDSAFASEMRTVAAKYPEDVTIKSLFAEAVMDIHPWNLWNKDGSPQPWTTEIMQVLKDALHLEPRHAGANHFYVHVMEMSKDAGQAMASADLLRELVPGSGHLVHMPSHTYIRTGRYHDGVISNQQASLKDSIYMGACHAQGIYPLAYYPHNYHFMAACATLSGESALALKGAVSTARHAEKSLMTDPSWSTLQHYYTIPWYVETKFGRWDQILATPQPDGRFKYPVAIWHYARGMALLAKNNIAEAKQQLAAITLAMTDTTIRELTIWGINNLFDLCAIAQQTLTGEILAKEKKYAAAIEALTDAVKKEDALNYDEPPDWFFSVRHHLGAVLVEAGKFNEAIGVYKQDLMVYPENGWAFAGLVNAYKGLHDENGREVAAEAFKRAWKFADIQLSSSRIL
ncbi:MAG: hypothetical protein EOO05_06750 [Chitinophagaceae bacterium]|nr:MAG: hypothetical protein EOO05_06750 [Chitinophagaceae bacterium]